MLYFIDLSNISHGMSRIQGGGEDTLSIIHGGGIFYLKLGGE